MKKSMVWKVPEQTFEQSYWWLKSFLIPSGVGLVALNRRLGCLAPDVHENSEPMRLINLVNDLFSCLHVNEFGLHLWRFYPTKSFRTLREKHNEFLRYFKVFSLLKSCHTNLLITLWYSYSLFVLLVSLPYSKCIT